MKRGAHLFLLMSLSGLAGSVLPSPAAADRLDYASLHDYNSALRKAIQARLREQKLYRGAIDGRMGPGTRAALAKLTGEPARSGFLLDDDLVEKLFGLEGHGVYTPEDEIRLLQALKIEAGSRYKPLADPVE